MSNESSKQPVASSAVIDPVEEAPAATLDDTTEAASATTVRSKIKKSALSLIGLGCLWPFVRWLGLPLKLQAGVEALFFGALGPLALALLAGVGYWRENRSRRQPELEPSIWGGALGGLFGGAVCGLLAWTVLGHAPSIPAYCALSGVVMGVCIQGATYAAYKFVIKEKTAKHLAGVNEWTGGAIGGVVGGAVCGSAGGLYFGMGDLHVTSLIFVIGASVVGSICLATGILLFDYSGRVDAVTVPMVIASVVAIVVGTIGAIVVYKCMLSEAECVAWGRQWVRYYLDKTGRIPVPVDPVNGNPVGIVVCRAGILLWNIAPTGDHAKAGLFYGIPSGALLGIQVGLSLFFERTRRSPIPTTTAAR